MLFTEPYLLVMMEYEGGRIRWTVGIAYRWRCGAVGRVVHGGLESCYYCAAKAVPSLGDV
jgi:hypothetical protein